MNKKLSLDLSFINISDGYMITDGTQEFPFHKQNVTVLDNLEQELKPNSGFIMVFKGRLN